MIPLRLRTALLIATLSSLTGALAQPVPATPERTVEGRTLISKSHPAATFQFPEPFKYAGARRLPIAGLADAEQHFFVDADAEGKIRRYFWVQFEHYFPSNSQTYQNQSEASFDLNGFTFFHDTRLIPAYMSGARPDPANGKEPLEKAGYTLPKEVARIRMFHYPDPDRRSVLMIIYVEAVPPSELPPGLKKAASADDLYPEWSKRMIEHVRENLTIGR